MKARHIQPFERRTRRARFLWTLAAVLAAALVVTTGPIFAEPNHGDSKYERHHRSDRHHEYDRHHRQDRHSGRDRHRDDDRYRHDDRHHRELNRGYDRTWRHRPGYYSDHRYDRRYDHRHFNFVVPRAIARGHLDRYDDYYYGRVYYPAHHHYHTVYRFPVFFEGELVYRPYAYCDGHYFATGFFGIDGPHFSIRIGF